MQDVLRNYWLPFGYPSYKKVFLVAKTIQHTQCRKVLEYQQVSAFCNTLKNVRNTTRNEKVACSSQVTSSTKNAVFLVKAAVFRTFRACLKEPHFCLASIWRLLRVFSIFSVTIQDIIRLLSRR